MKKTLKRMLTKTMGILPSSAVLMLHNITDSPVVKKQILLSQEKFYQLVDSFSNWCSIELIVKKSSRKGIVLTFDDGFEDVYTVAWPYLKARNVPFTVFVTFEKLDTEGYLSKEQLKEMSKDELCTIGAHCYHHLPLAKLSQENQEFELLESKKMIEKIIEKPVLYMAYPYGQYNKNTLKVLRKKKPYKAAFIVGRGFLNFVSGYSKYQLPRIGMDNQSFEKNFVLLKNKYKRWIRSGKGGEVN